MLVGFVEVVVVIELVAELLVVVLFLLLTYSRERDEKRKENRLFTCDT